MPVSLNRSIAIIVDRIYGRKIGDIGEQGGRCAVLIFGCGHSSLVGEPETFKSAPTEH